MGSSEFLLLVLAVAAVALLYSSVGHAGASGYIAVMALAAVPATEIRPAALTLNIAVATTGAIQFWRGGHFSWPLFWPFAVLAVPAALIGGMITLPGFWLHRLLGLTLLFSAWRLFWRREDAPGITAPRRIEALPAGAALGLLAGLTGTGGGIFLTPLLLFCRWAETRKAAAVSAVFILVNSLAGLAGYLGSGGEIPLFTWTLAAAAVAGGYLGSRLGSRTLRVAGIRLLLALVLLVAGSKLLMLQ